MTERVRPSQDIRIVPGTAPGSAAAPGASSNAAAVRIFQLLAVAAGSGPLSEPVARDDDRAPANPHDDASATAGAASTNTSLEAPQREQRESPGVSAQDPAGGTPVAHTSRTGARLDRSREDRASEPAEHDVSLGKQIVHACAAAAHGELFTRELAERIARFCSMSGASGDASWAVTLPMNPAVLPDTLLHLQLSPVSIALRFETGNSRSAQLISENADALRARLSDALGRRIDVDITA